MPTTANTSRFATAAGTRPNACPMRCGPFAETLHRLGQCKGIEQIITHPRSEICQRRQKSPVRWKNTAGGSWASSQCRTAAQRNTISMPPEKSAYCCSEYSKMASSAIEPASLGSLPSRMAAIVRAVRFAMAYFFITPNRNRRQCTLGTLPVPNVTGSELRGHLSVAVDGTLDQLREKADESRKRT